MPYKTYHYHHAVKTDVKEYIKEHNIAYEISSDYMIEKYLKGLDKSVTGETTESYTHDPKRAARYLLGNYDLVRGALEKFGGRLVPVEMIDPEILDVLVRSYILPNVAREIFDEMADDDWLPW